MLALSYGFFAAISVIVNLLSQIFFFKVYSGIFSLYFAMFFGTITGLITKYILDKKYIFNYKAVNKIDDTKKFFLYSAMGIVTTLIFWVTEIFFDIFFQVTYAKYLGAIIGLSIGYSFKYSLDKKYVFTNLELKP
jgi:putative flippase GtrA